MLNKTKNNRKNVLRYLLIVPCLSILMMTFSFVEKSPQREMTVSKTKQELLIGEISWEGNTVYSDKKLGAILGLKKGDYYDEQKMNLLLFGSSHQMSNPAKASFNDISSLYLDNGHLFFSLEVEKEVKSNIMNLTFNIFEGDKIVVDQLIISGNKEVSTQKIQKMIKLKKGDLFSRQKLIMSQNMINKSGFFDPDQLVISPTPHGVGDKLQLVDIEFKVVER